MVSSESDAKILQSVQDRFAVNITKLPDEIDSTTYSKWVFVTDHVTLTTNVVTLWLALP